MAAGLPVSGPFRAFEVRTYRSLIRHRLCAPMMMDFLAGQTQRLRRENPRVALEQVADVANTLASTIWNRWRHSWTDPIDRCEYYQARNEASYRGRRRTGEKQDRS